jgi:DNA-binding response OmpR family regulator
MIKNSLKDLKVLLVEDEENLAILLKKAIGDNFYSFTIANNGEEGLKKFLEIMPDIVITDIMMPKLNGLEMAKELKLLNPNIPIIILSAFSETDKLLNAIDLGITKYFIKPYDPDELLDYICHINKNLQTKPIMLEDGFIFYKTKRCLYKDSQYIDLSKREILFIELLLKNYQEITDSKVIKDKLWKKNEGSDIRLRSFIKRFRIKTSKNIVNNIKGRGYHLNLYMELKKRQS